ncbi:hypothetical protein [Kribbella sp. NPDC051718]|uniref:hypothetical protein n=1 Tax=Kribbella sp. NPDC051718 TaxID=3155168 RepID=UPI0034367B2A
MTEDPVGVALLKNADELRGHLDTLNDAGTDDRCVGVDFMGEPFLAALTGPYAGGVRVVCCDPEDIERDQVEYCDDCGQATKRFDETTLRYPVVVLTGRPR